MLSNNKLSQKLTTRASNKPVFFVKMQSYGRLREMAGAVTLRHGRAYFRYVTWPEAVKIRRA